MLEFHGCMLHSNVNAVINIQYISKTCSSYTQAHTHTHTPQTLHCRLKEGLMSETKATFVDTHPGICIFTYMRKESPTSTTYKDTCFLDVSHSRSVLTTAMGTKELIFPVRLPLLLLLFTLALAQTG